MRVRDLMTGAPRACTRGDDCARAAAGMWESDCGMLPVVDEDNRPVGAITDRDICIAAATQHRAPAELRVGDVMATNLATCEADDDVRDALATMRHRQVRRLPVVDGDGRLVGVFSMNDAIQEAAEGKARGGVSHADVMTALQAIGRPAQSPAAAASA